jgi:glycosyltransferase 2 family protein
MGLFSKSKWKFWLGLIVGIFFLGLAFWGQDFAAIGKALSEANYLWLLPGLALYFIGVGVRAIRWHYLLGPIQKVAVRRLFPVVVVGYMANNVLPVRMGEVVRAYVLDRRENVRKTASLATIVVERIMDGITMILFLSIVSLFVHINSSIEGIEKLAAVVFLVGISVFFGVAHSRKWMKQLESFGLRFVPAKLRPKVAGLADAFIDGLQVLRQWRDLLMVFLLSILAWACEGGMYWMVALAFNSLNLSVGAVFMTLAVANLATLVPSTPGYVGPFDAAAKLVLVQVFGIAQGLALSYVILLHAALYLPITLLGLYYWLTEHFSFKEADQVRQQTTNDKIAAKLSPELTAPLNLLSDREPTPVAARGKER